MTLAEMKAELSTRTTFSTESFDNERLVRKAVSELRKEGIIFTPIKSIVQSQKHWYAREEVTMNEQMKKYARTQIKSWKTQYFNTIVPIKHYLEEQEFKELMGELL